MQIKVSLFSLLLIIMILAGVNPVIGREKAPGFTLVNIDGKEFSLSDYRGKVVLIDLFRIEPSCPPCIYQIPHLKGVYGKYSQDEVVIMSLSVSSLDTDDTLRSDFVEEYDIPWIVACGGNDIAYKYSVSAVPTLVVVDTEGNVGHRHEGVTKESTLTSEISNLLSEPENGDSNGNSDGDGDSNGDSDGEPAWISIELVGIIGVAVVSFLIIGIVVAGRIFHWSEPAKKRRKRKH